MIEPILQQFCKKGRTNLPVMIKGFGEHGIKASLLELAKFITTDLHKEREAKRKHRS